MRSSALFGFLVSARYTDARDILQWLFRRDWRGEWYSCIPQAELSVASGIGVPVGERGHPPLQPRALDDEVGERGLRHVEGICGGGMVLCIDSMALDCSKAIRSKLQTRDKPADLNAYWPGLPACTPRVSIRSGDSKLRWSLIVGPEQVTSKAE